MLKIVDLQAKDLKINKKITRLFSFKEDIPGTSDSQPCAVKVQGSISPNEGLELCTYNFALIVANSSKSE